MADDDNWLGNYILAKETGWGKGSGATWGRFERSLATRPISTPVFPPVEIPKAPTDHIHIPQIDFSAGESSYGIGQLLMIMAGLILLCLAAIAGFWLISSFTVWPAWIKYTCIGIACLAAAPPVFIGLAFAVEIITGIIEALVALIQFLFALAIGLSVLAGIGYMIFTHLA